jgi:PAS domain S-box-containing protein
MRGYEDTLERVIISTEDITSQKQAERIIRSSQQRIESLIDTIDGIVWECDYNTFEFTFVNKKAEQITGYPVEQWLYNPTFWAEKIHPDDREEAINFCMESSQTKNQYDFEYRMLASNGSVIWMRDIVNVIREDGVPVSLKGIMIDIIKTKEAENELNATLELVNEQKKRLMNFSYIVSHNLRSHAANIQSIVSLYDTAESDEERNEFVTMLKTVSRSLNETMVHLHDLVNIQSNGALTSEPLNLRHYAEMALRTLSDQIEGKKASVANNIPENVTVRYNAAYLESVLHNLFSNALRYSHPDRKPLITADWEQQDGKNILKVADNGVGIDMARFGDKLFGMYKTFHGNPEARGIGLFMTKNQVEAMGGTIEVESEAGKGTTFKVSFAS